MSGKDKAHATEKSYSTVERYFTVQISASRRDSLIYMGGEPHGECLLKMQRYYVTS